MRLWADPVRAAHIQEVIRDVICRIGTYLVMKTLINLTLAVASYAILRIWGIEFAGFWAPLIGLFNYIGPYGSFVRPPMLRRSVPDAAQHLRSHVGFSLLGSSFTPMVYGGFGNGWAVVEQAGSTEDWTVRFAGLSRLAPEIKAKLLTESRVAGVPRDTEIFGPGKAPENLLLLLDGTVRVQQTSESGREVFLYRVTAGESCVLTTACLLAYEDYTAEGLAETDLKAVLVPRTTFDELVARSPEFRRFVFTAYARRITDLFHVIEEVAFRRIDVRLAHKLLAFVGEDGTLQATHATLATELGSVREVVSRQLQEFQRRGWVELGRGVVRITAPAALRRLAEER